MRSSVFLKKHTALSAGALALVIFMATILSSCGLGNMKRYEVTYLDVFDTVTQLVIFAKTEAEAAEIAEETHALLIEYNRLFDIYHGYENVDGIYKVNEGAAEAPVEADARVVELLSFAKEAYALTGGRVNVAMGSVLRLWHERRESAESDPSSASLPDMEALRKAAQHTDIDAVVLDEAMSTVYFADPEMSLDVGAVAKGFAAERIAVAMEERGVESMLISIGGNVRTIGARADGKDYLVGVQDPWKEGGMLHTVNVSGMSLVTSGTYQRFFTVDGKRYHHIIDQDTLMPSAYFESVSVLTADSALADALSTALFNMPYEEGAVLAASLEGVDALWIFQDGTEKMTEGFASALAD